MGHPRIPQAKELKFRLVVIFPFTSSIHLARISAMTEREGKLSEFKTTSEHCHAGLIGLLNTTSDEFVRRGASGLSSEERDEIQHAVQGLGDEADFAAIAKAMKWRRELQGRGRTDVRTNIASQLHESYVSEPCQEYVLYDWDQNIDRLDRLVGHPPAGIMKQSPSQRLLEELGKNPEFSGTIFNILKATEIEQILYYITMQRRLATLKIAGKIGLLDLSIELNVKHPEAEIMSRWRNALMGKYGGFA